MLGYLFQIFVWSNNKLKLIADLKLWNVSSQQQTPGRSQHCYLMANECKNSYFQKPFVERNSLCGLYIEFPRPHRTWLTYVWLCCIWNHAFGNHLWIKSSMNGWLNASHLYSLLKKYWFPRIQRIPTCNSVSMPGDAVRAHWGPERQPTQPAWTLWKHSSLLVWRHNSSLDVDMARPEREREWL